MARKSWTDSQLISAVRRSVVISDVLRKLGLSIRTENYRTITRAIHRLQLNTSHMLGRFHGRRVPDNKKELKRKRFGKLLALEKFGKNERGGTLWKCMCDCGNTSIVKAYNLIVGNTKSCGCLPTGPKVKDAVGEVHNRLTVEKFAFVGRYRDRYYRCRCSCGNTTIAKISSVRNGNTKSCGCWKRECDKNRYREKNPNWNEELTDEERELRRDVQGYNEWCLAVKRLADFSCAVCGSRKSGMLRSHHLESYSANKKLRLQTSNGACICVVCHLFFHKIFGFIHNTRSQFDLFIKTINQLKEEKE